MVGRVVATLGVWAFAGLVCILVISRSTVGPTLYSIDAVHGIHLGDVVSLLGFPAWAFVVSRTFWRRDPT